MTDDSTAVSRPVRVLHVTDPHLFADAAGELRGVVTADSLERVLEHYRSSAWQADLVSATGDLIHDDSAQAYQRFANMLGTLNLPVYCIPGNHDTRKLMQQVLPAASFHYCAAVRRGSWLIVGADSCVTKRAGGAITDSELDRLDRVIAQSNAAHVLVCLHHPPVSMGSKWLDTVGLENAEAFMQRIAASGRVRAVIFGHVHQDFEARHAGIHLIATPSTCRQFLPLSEDFAVDDKPPAYRRITLHPDGRFESELIWLSR